MPKGTFLSDQEKIQIKFFHDQGCSNREIGRKIDRSESVVRNFWKKVKFMEFGNLQREIQN